jgi:hypothetical protein
MITWDAVTAVAPELAAVPIGVQTALLSMVGVMLPNPNALGDQYDAACTWLAAHLGTISQRKSGNIAGPISSESVGQVSRSYAVPTTESASDLSSTSYGQLAQMLIKNNANTRVVLL